MVLMHEFAAPYLMVRSSNKGSALEEGLPTRSSAEWDECDNVIGDQGGFSLRQPMSACSLLIIGAGPGGLATGITAKEPGFESCHHREGRKHMSGHYRFLSERGKLP